MSDKQEHWQDILQKAKDEFTYTQTAEPCLDCKQLDKYAPDVNLLRIMSDIQIDKQRRMYNRLSLWGKLKFKLRKWWNRIRHKQAPILPVHDNCRCMLERIDEGGKNI